jgi:hypothetical protein
VTRPALAGALIFVLCALLRIGLVDRQSLWADEFFSLAMATGHSLSIAWLSQHDRTLRNLLISVSA